MHIFCRAIHTYCYGPELMHYPTICGIYEDGEVAWEHWDDVPWVEDVGAVEEDSPTVVHNSVEIHGVDPMQLMALLHASDDTEYWRRR